jgi:hypothetical protein
MLSLVLATFMACGQKNPANVVSAAQVTAPAVAPTNFPSWVLNPPKGKNEVCAVGSYKMKGNISMAQQTSTSRARDELSRQIQVFTKSMIKDYIEEGETGGESFTEELVTSVSKQVSSMSLSGTAAAKQEVAEGTMYTLVCLDTEKFASAFDDMNEVSEKAKQALRTRAKAGFDELDAEVDSLNNSAE